MACHSSAGKHCGAPLTPRSLNAHVHSTKGRVRKGAAMDTIRAAGLAACALGISFYSDAHAATETDGGGSTHQFRACSTSCSKRRVNTARLRASALVRGAYLGKRTRVHRTSASPFSGTDWSRARVNFGIGSATPARPQFDARRWEVRASSACVIGFICSSARLMDSREGPRGASMPD